MIKSVEIVPGLKCVVKLKYGKKSQTHKNDDWSKVNHERFAFFGAWQKHGSMCDMIYLPDGTQYEVVVGPKRLPQTSSQFVTIKLDTGEVCYTWLLCAMRDAEKI